MTIDDKNPEKIPAGAEMFFPLFINMSGRKVLVIGGGSVAERRIHSLAGCGAEIIVITPAAGENVTRAALAGMIQLIKRKYNAGDIGAFMPFIVIAASDDRQINHNVMLESRKLNIPVSVADCRGECTCCFPAIVESGDYIAALVSKNGDHSGVRETAQKMREFLDL